MSTNLLDTEYFYIIMFDKTTLKNFFYSEYEVFSVVFDMIKNTDIKAVIYIAATYFKTKYKNYLMVKSFSCKMVRTKFFDYILGIVPV